MQKHLLLSLALVSSLSLRAAELYNAARNLLASRGGTVSELQQAQAIFQSLSVRHLSVPPETRVYLADLHPLYEACESIPPTVMQAILDSAYKIDGIIAEDGAKSRVELRLASIRLNMAYPLEKNKIKNCAACLAFRDFLNQQDALIDARRQATGDSAERKFREIISQAND